MSSPVVAVLAPLDTKATEAHYLRESIEKRGMKTLLVDIGYGKPAPHQADITTADLARTTGHSAESFYAMRNVESRSNLIIEGATKTVLDLIAQGRCNSIIGFGGASNTSLATAVMQAVPFGIPKLVLSSAPAPSDGWRRRSSSIPPATPPHHG